MIGRVRRFFSGNLATELDEIREVTIQTDDKVDEMIRFVNKLSSQGIHLSLHVRLDKEAGDTNER